MMKNKTPLCSMLKFIVALLAITLLFGTTPATVRALDHCCDIKVSNNDIYLTQDSIDVDWDHIETFMEWDIVRIYREDHVFGYDAWIDALFDGNASFIELAVVTREFAKKGALMTRTATCTPGNHGNVTITTTTSRDSHAGHGAGGGFCVRIRTIVWHCTVCTTRGVEETRTFFWCDWCPFHVR